MEFLVKRNDLLQELSLVMGVVEKRHSIPILANVLLEVSKEYLGITGTDQDVGIRCGCAVEARSEGAMTVPSRKLFDIVRLLPDADLHFVVHSNNWVEIRCQNSNFKIAGLPKDNYPDVPEYKGQRLSIPVPALKEMILRTIFAITQEESRYTLNGALAIVLPTMMKMVTTDGHRLAYVEKALEMDGVSGEIRVLIPKKTLAELLKLMEQQLTVEMGRDERHLFFRVGSRELVSKVLAGQFPNFEMVLPKDNNQIMVCNTALFNDSLRRAAIMADEKNRPVKFILRGGSLELVANTADQGESREKLDVEYRGTELAIAFNAQYVMDFLSTVKTEKISMELKDQETQVLLRPNTEEDFNYQYVVMPMTI